ncbi:putative bifunctional diguanylate cyclase/phosphodiesterase [Quadrisphaera setariae]|uniref:Bifunctional diguanylate cyclase/phosphodiesterase n=1 Tax=Quadrisphaera setariae TaxID=2593304 RepID=A0A5C8Z5Q6_9ACTN|nr:bifunctional diguanylate cyclase/phosphodiesterase [Quadrisphaera setariae]TXR52684.1 bifunctional diguanylate cyclase/phosphodiesterase [Quadrisphaera setariae]
MITEARTGPGTQVRVGALAALLLVLPAAAAPLCTPQMPPTWVVVSAWVAVMALVWAQARVLSHHVAVSAGSLWHDALLATLACASALLVLLLPVLRGAAGMGEALAVLVLVEAAAAVVSLGTGLSTLAQARRGADPRVVWSVAAGAVAVVSQVLWPLRMAVPALREPWPSAALAVVVLLGWAVVVAGLVRASVPAEVQRRRAPWDEDLVSVLTCGTVATGVLLVGALVGIPTAAALAAALALVLLLSKVRLLVRELVSLQGSHEAAVTDELTGLGNRRSLVAALDAALQTREDVALLLLDLDRFKHVNDAMGHLAGDELLRQVAARLRGVMVSGAVLARLGGDEFAVLLSGPAARAAHEVALGVHAALLQPAAVEGHLVHAPASIGVAQRAAAVTGGAGGHVTSTGDDLLRRADTAMYAAKTGRSGVAVHGHDHDRRARELLQTAEELRVALAHGELVLHYQPQVAVADGALVGVEALVRWQHPRRGLVAPDAFLGVAQDVGLGEAVTDAVLRLAVAQAAAWRAAGTPVRVSVNLTAHDVQPALVGRVSGLLLAHGLRPGLLAVEITETSVVADPVRAAAVLRDLVGLGVEVSVDDFGTGHSSLTLLLQLPVHEVKVDRSFVAALCTDSARRHVVRATVDLAHGLGMRVVAEGVEDHDVLAQLADLGCDTSQGYLHSRPLPPGQLTAWMAARASAPALRAG